MDKIRIAGILVILLFLIDVVIYTVQPMGEETYVIEDMIPVLFGCFTVIAGIYAMSFHGLSSLQGRALFFLTLGEGLWVGGEFLWAYQEVVLGIEELSVSIADLSWIAGYLPYLIGMYLVWTFTRTPLTQNKKVLITITSCLIFLIVFFYGSLNVLSDLSGMEILVNGWYVFGDIILLIGGIILVISFWGGKFAKPWIIITLSIIVSAVADMVYFYILPWYETGNLIDVLWDLDYLLGGFGFIYYRESVKNLLKASFKP